MTREKVADAEAALDVLAAALERCGIVLPSLGIDLVTYCGQPPRPLIELGRCNPETARRLAVVLGDGGGAS
ncbi:MULTISPECIES: hypothetical protein [unclassified Streptomyces]|uniref:hypothetical protein n=1 Tax=unclassified Streptomyces TaxID=2593676 RepID=UPI00035C6035|nr:MULTISPECIES: hypothetical protein [unclassified Streptomyces]MYT33528.1 hypothetical protein [Streptomyces sp. SID8354]